ncbi:MAG: DUF11 domain-containing protein [Oscillospiraceae bacterium]|nr:DUF11 domain-containing protein [Oscillospiraceae bacterium]
MATFTNFATLSYDGGSTVSNTVTGEILETLAVTKTAVIDEYTSGGNVTYVVTLVNSGTVPFSGLTVTDDLGGYEVGATTVYPLELVPESVRYYIGGVLQPTPTVVAGPPMTVSGISVPAGGNSTLIYQTSVTEFAPPVTASAITNTVSVTGNGVSTAVTASETVTVRDDAVLTITKTLSPSVVAENGQITYTFVIENTGNTPAAATDNLVVTDVFDPILSDITVTYNGAVWQEGTGYTYDETTGTFTTVAGQITVPSATYTQNPDGSYTAAPGVAVITVTGTV